MLSLSGKGIAVHKISVEKLSLPPFLEYHSLFIFIFFIFSYLAFNTLLFFEIKI